MKKKLTLFLMSFVFASAGLFAQNCTPVNLGGPGITPPSDNLDCVERGTPYSETVFVQNFSTVSVAGFQANVDFLRVDSVVNLPCGLDYQMNTSQQTNNNTIASGDSACLSIFGTSYDFVGQYKIGLYITVQISTPIGPQVFSGEAVQLIEQIEGIAGQPLGLNFNYWLRVTEPGGACNPADTSGTAWNLMTSATCPNPSDYLVKALARSTEICDGDSVELYATTAGATGANTYSWTPTASLIGASSQSPTAFPSSDQTYTVDATDGSSNASGTVEITIAPEPIASFTASVNIDQVTFTNASVDADSYEWDFGDGTNSTSPNPTKTYVSADTFTVSLTATNQCGSDVFTQDVIIESTGFCTLDATCSPQSPTGDLGLSPVADNVNCADKGVFYQQYLYLEVPSSITFSGISASINFLQIDAVENLPCGLSFRFDQKDQNYAGGETGCLEIYGVTDDAVGQYDLALFITLSVTIPGLGTQEFSGRADELIAQLEDALGSQLGIDFNYWIRVKTSGSSCPALDRSGNNDLTASCEPFQAIASGSSCDGADGTLSADGQGGYPPYTIEWEGGNTNSDTLVGPNDVLLLKVTDSEGNVSCAEVQLTPSSNPVADFSFSLGTDLTVDYTDDSDDGMDYAWDFGDGETSTDQDPTHVYDQEGLYTVELTVTNDCGTSTTSKDVLVEPSSIRNLDVDFSISIMPNPNEGVFFLNIKTEKSENGVLSAYDMSGKVVYQENLAIVNGRKAIDLKGVSQGVYVLELRTEKGRKIEKLVIK